MTASTTSSRVLMRPGPTGLTLSPTTSFLVKNSPKLFLRLFPVSSRIPFSNMALTTAASTFPSGMAAGSWTSTTRPGNGPGRLHLVRGTLRASSMLVLGLGGGPAGLAGGCWPWVCWAARRLRPAMTRPAPIAPPAFRKSRRPTAFSGGIER